MDMKQSLKQSSIKIIRYLEKIRSWDSSRPFDSYCQGSSLESDPGHELYDVVVLFQRLQDLFLQDNSGSELLSFVWSQGQGDLVDLMRTLPFLPRGVPLFALQQKGYGESRLTAWRQCGLLDYSTEHGYTAVESWSLVLYYNQKVTIPLRRMGLPLSLLVALWPYAAVTRLFEELHEDLDKPLAGLGQIMEGRDRELINHVYHHKTSLAKRLALIWTLRIILSKLAQGELDADSLTYYFQYISASLRQESTTTDYNFFPHPNEANPKAYALPMSLPQTFWLRLSQPNALNSFFDVRSKSQKDLAGIQQQMQRKQGQLRWRICQLLLAVDQGNVSSGNQQPELRYLRFVSAEWLNDRLTPWLSQWSVYAGLIQRHGEGWRLHPRASALDYFATEEVAINFLYFLLWHPGLPFVSEASAMEGRVQEEFKASVWSFLMAHRGRVVALEPASDDDPQLSLWHSGGEDSLRGPQTWLERMVINKVFISTIKDFFDLLDQLGWLIATGEASGSYYICPSLPDWDPMGSYLRDWPDGSSLAQLPQKQTQTFLRILPDQRLEVTSASLAELFYLREAAFLLRLGDSLEWQFSRSLLEKNFSEKPHFHELADFLRQRAEGDLEPLLNALQLMSQPTTPERAYLYWQHHVLRILDFEHWQQLYDYPSFAEAVYESYTIAGGVLALLLPSHTDSVRQILRQNGLDPLEVAPTTAEQGRVGSPGFPPGFQRDKDPLPFSWQYHDFFLYRVLQFWRKNPITASHSLQQDGGWESGLTTPKMLEMIYQALESHMQVEIEYHARSQDYKSSRRVVKPYRIEDDYLIGYCYLRLDERMFHLDRITAMRLKAE